HLVGQVARHRVDAVGEVLPGARHAAHFRLAAQFSVRPHFSRYAGDFGGEGVELIDHDVDRLFQLQDLAPGVGGNLLGEVAVGDGGCDFGYVAHLVGQVARHRVDAVREVLP